MEASCQRHALTALLPGNNPGARSNRRLGGSQSESGLFGEKKTLLPATGIRTPDRAFRGPVSVRTTLSLAPNAESGQYEMPLFPYPPFAHTCFLSCVSVCTHTHTHTHTHRKCVQPDLVDMRNKKLTHKISLHFFPFSSSLSVHACLVHYKFDHSSHLISSHLQYLDSLQHCSPAICHVTHVQKHTI